MHFNRTQHCNFVLNVCVCVCAWMSTWSSIAKMPYTSGKAQRVSEWISQPLPQTPNLRNFLYIDTCVLICGENSIHKWEDEESFAMEVLPMHCKLPTPDICAPWCPCRDPWWKRHIWTERWQKVLKRISRSHTMDTWAHKFVCMVICHKNAIPGAWLQQPPPP